MALCFFDRPGFKDEPRSLPKNLKHYSTTHNPPPQLIPIFYPLSSCSTLEGGSCHHDRSDIFGLVRFQLIDISCSIGFTAFDISPSCRTLHLFMTYNHIIGHFKFPS